MEEATTVEEAGTTEDRANGGAEEGVELEEVGGEEDGQEEEQDSHQTTKISDTRMTSITKVIDILVIVFNRIGLQEAEVSIVTVIRGLLIIRIHIKEVGDMDQLALATIATSSKYLRCLNSVIQGKLRKLLGFCVYPCLIMLFILHSAQIRIDMEEWNKSSIWPLSCYAYSGKTPCLPGFADVSPEELRWEAYRAKASGNSEHYLKNVSQLNDKRLKLMHEFSNLTKDDVRDMVSKSITSRGLASLAPCLYLIVVFVSVVK